MSQTKHATSDLFRLENDLLQIGMYADARFIAVCTQCGSDDVCSDAAARWSVDQQAWTLSGVHDDNSCGYCNGECRVIDVPWDDADAIETFLRRAFNHLTEPGERPTFTAWLEHEAVAHVNPDDDSPRIRLAQRLHVLRNPPVNDAIWEFVRLGEPGPTSATYYCAADPLQTMAQREASAFADYLGPQWAAIRDDDGDWVFAGPFRSEEFRVKRGAAMAHVYKVLHP